MTNEQLEKAQMLRKKIDGLILFNAFIEQAIIDCAPANVNDEYVSEVVIVAQEKIKTDINRLEKEFEIL